MATIIGRSMLNGIDRLTVWAYGANFINNMSISGVGLGGGGIPKDGTDQTALIETTRPGATTITLVDIADASKFGR